VIGAGARGPRSARPVGRPVGALLGATVVGQISYPLVHGAARNAVTIAIVVLAGVAALVHAGLTRGARVAAAVGAATALGGFGVEVLGVHTRLPFGGYTYAGSLGPSVFAVPVVIALAWTMLAWPAALAARRLVAGTLNRVLIGAWALATWDLFLDPQMVAAGHWRWAHVAAHLPGVPAVPLTNFAGWLVVAFVLSVVLQTVVLREPADEPSPGADTLPLAFYIWTWASSGLALAAFLGLPAAALWGLIGMGTVAVPLLLLLVRRPAPASPARSSAVHA
jgi:putative membrane protein